MVKQRITKKLLVENGAPTAADKRIIQDGIDEALWFAVLKPESVGVATYRDTTRTYDEIAVVSAQFREAAKAKRLVELLHRAIPYPLVLITSGALGTVFSLANKRQSLGEKDRVVVDAVKATDAMQGESTPTEETFMEHLALDKHPTRNLYTLYQGWHACIDALAAARITGTYATKPDPALATAREAALECYGRLQRDIAQLRAQAKREKQLNRQVELNLRVKQLEAELAEAMGNL